MIQIRRRTMNLSVFCGVSVDGFLARPNRALDFLRTGEQEPHGFEEFYAASMLLLSGAKPSKSC
jgi:hypothetical protein